MLVFTVFLVFIWFICAFNTLIWEREMFWICFKQDLRFGRTLIVVWALVWACKNLVEFLV